MEYENGSVYLHAGLMRTDHHFIPTRARVFMYRHALDFDIDTIFRDNGFTTTNPLPTGS
jgi:hypothetical protein